MRSIVAAWLVLFLVGLATMPLGAQPLLLTQAPPRGPAPATPAPAAPIPEIKLDEGTTLRAAAIEARMSAVLANFALLQRQAQDMQQEMTRLLEERKKLIEGAARQSSVDVKDANEWAFDNKGQRYIRVRGAP